VAGCTMSGIQRPQSSWSSVFRAHRNQNHGLEHRDGGSISACNGPAADQVGVLVWADEAAASGSTETTTQNASGSKTNGPSAW